MLHFSVALHVCTHLNGKTKDERESAPGNTADTSNSNQRADKDHKEVLNIVVTKNPPMGQIMRFSLYCINGPIEGKHITLKICNNTLLAMKSELHTEEFL